MGFMCDPDSLTHASCSDISRHDSFYLWSSTPVRRLVCVSVHLVNYFFFISTTIFKTLINHKKPTDWWSGTAMIVSFQQAFCSMGTFQSWYFVGMTLLQHKASTTNAKHQMDQYDDSGQFKNAAPLWPVLILHHHYTSVTVVTVCMCSTDAKCIS